MNPVTTDQKLPSRLEARRMETDALISDAVFEIDIAKPTRGWDFVSLEAARRRVRQFGRSLGKLHGGDARAVAKLQAIQIDFLPREELKRRALGEDVLGQALTEERRILIADDMDRESDDKILAHELAHHLLTIACDASPEGEELAEEFAGAFVEGWSRQLPAWGV